MRRNHSKPLSLTIIAAIYILSTLIAFAIYHYSAHLGTLWALFLADVAATIIVWAAGLYFENPSVYDPYWSIAPMVIIPIFILLNGNGIKPTNILVLIAVLFWGTRLTYNWVSGWRGLNQCDWRYDMLKAKNPNLWFITNFFGINMMPTVLVYLGMIPAYYLIQSNSPISFYTVLGFVICISSASIQMVSDKQMESHRMQKTSENINTGLWAYSRHPNYFGEVMFWWGIFIMTIGISTPLLAISGAVLMTLLFVFISIPMMEEHVQEKNPSYIEYKNEVSMLVPWKRKK